MRYPAVNGGNPIYMAALTILDGDMPQYIHDNTDDEISHAAFLKNYLESKGASAVSLEPFRHLPTSKATGANQNFLGDGGRLTNLTQLTIDTSFWTRYRSITNPDFDPAAKIYSGHREFRWIKYEQFEWRAVHRYSEE